MTSRNSNLITMAMYAVAIGLMASGFWAPGPYPRSASS